MLEQYGLVIALACVAMIDSPAAHHGIERPPA